MMSGQTVLLLGRTQFDEEATRSSIDPALDVEILTANSLNDVRDALSKHDIDVVIVGAGLDETTRVDVVRHVITASPTTTVHLKDRASGREGMMPFVNGVLTGLTWHQWSWSERGGEESAPLETEAFAGHLRSEGNLFYRMWKYLFGRSDPPEHPPPPPHSPGAGV